MFDEPIKMLKEFNDTYGVCYKDTPDLSLNNDYSLRVGLMQEELNEYKEAVNNKDAVAVADALSDLMYVVLGTVLAHGYQDKFSQLFSEVHKSNMSKLGLDGKPIYHSVTGKVLKGPNFREPNLGPIIKGSAGE